MKASILKSYISFLNKSKKLVINDLAESMKMTRQNLFGHLSRNGDVSPLVLAGICKFLKISETELLQKAAEHLATQQHTAEMQLHEMPVGYTSKYTQCLEEKIALHNKYVELMEENNRLRLLLAEKSTH